MRTIPIYLAALGTAAVVGGVPAAQRRDLVRHFRCRNVLEPPVAFHAAGERRDRTAQVKAFQNLRQLESGARLAHEVPVRHSAALQQIAVAGEDDAMLARRQKRECFVVRLGLVRGVESDHAQIGRELAEMDIRDEPGLAQRVRADARQGRDVESLKDGVDAHPVAILHDAVEIDGLPVDEHQVHFGVRHSQGLNQVLDGLPVGETVLEGTGTLFLGQEAVQFGIEAEAGLLHLSTESRIPEGNSFER